MNIECPHCNTLISIQAEKFSDLNELDCTACAKKTRLKNGSSRLVKLQFFLTDSEVNPEKNISEISVETFHQMEW
jgi:hypothetical protein